MHSFFKQMIDIYISHAHDVSCRPTRLAPGGGCSSQKAAALRRGGPWKRALPFPPMMATRPWPRLACTLRCVHAHRQGSFSARAGPTRQGSPRALPALRPHFPCNPKRAGATCRGLRSSRQQRRRRGCRHWWAMGQTGTRACGSQAQSQVARGVSAAARGSECSLRAPTARWRGTTQTPSMSMNLAAPCWCDGLQPHAQPQPQPQTPCVRAQACLSGRSDPPTRQTTS